MKITVIEIRKAEFREPPGSQPYCRIDVTYDMYSDDEYLKTFYSEESVEAYIHYLQETKKDYEKVIKEIEI